ncbi:MAG: hypothetical protein FWD47_09940 [Treponema sp.]|nr:hypothetical protein [Treponema sp.]
MTVNKSIISAIYNYKEETNKDEDKQVIFIPCLFIHEQLIFASFIHYFTENKFFRSFVNQWGDKSGYDWNKVLDNFYGEIDKFKMLMILIQGAIDNIEYSEMLSMDVIKRENMIFANKVLKMINAAEKRIWNLLQREKFLALKSRIMNFNSLVTMLKTHEPRLIFNQIALYSQLDIIVEKFGTLQLKAE